MSLVKCRTIGCPHHVREGLKRHPYVKGIAGQDLADGEFCWRCRARQAPKKPKSAKKT